MNQRPVAKKRIDQINADHLAEPPLSGAQQEAFRRGIDLFNARKFWEAHEVWEEIWKDRPEDSRIFFQGIIQAAAGWHLIVTVPRQRGALGNIRKALTILEVFPQMYLGIDVGRLRQDLLEARKVVLGLGTERLKEFPGERISPIRFTTPY
ncbi:MAG: DUF309 domain-containing protein [Bacteroidota bacterium]